MITKSKLIEISDVKVALSTLWAVVMISILSADVIGMIEPGTLQKMMAGNVGFTITPAIIIVVSLIQAIPIVMILVSRWFRRDVNRWLNILASVLTLAYVFGGGNWENASYPVFAALEGLAMLGILWLAWNWRSNEA
jgi:hypothetical protein